MPQGCSCGARGGRRGWWSTPPGPRLSRRVRTGSAPDPRSQRHARCRGYDLSDLRARALNRRDFERVDLLLTMDGDNLDCVTERCPPAQAHKLARLMRARRRAAGDRAARRFAGA